MPAHHQTLRKKLLRFLLIPLSLLFLIDASGSYFIATSLSDVVYDRELDEIARELSLHVGRRGGQLEFDLPQEIKRTLLTDPDDKIYFAIYSADGALIAGDPALARPNLSPFRENIRFYDSTENGDKIRAAMLRLQGGNDSAGTSDVVLVAETLFKRHALTEKIVFGETVPQLLLILIAGLLVWAGVGRGLAPLQKLRAAVASRSHSDLSPLMIEGTPEEVHPLLLAINDLMARLNEVLDFQGRFIADAAHQLRTPVAGLKAHIEVALRETDFEQTKSSLAHLYLSVERVSRLVSQLLSYARNEPNLVKKHGFAPLDLNKLAFETTMEWVPEAYKKNIDLGFEGVGFQLQVNGDATRLRELINNLLDNAIRYSSCNGRVTVRVTAENGPSMSISDDGPIIPQEERQRVFERFHRLLDGHSDGSGLGLAIVREIAAIHDATITLVDDTDGVGNTFTVSFPEYRAG